MTLIHSAPPPHSHTPPSPPPLPIQANSYIKEITQV